MLLGKSRAAPVGMTQAGSVMLTKTRGLQGDSRFLMRGISMIKQVDRNPYNE
jgi:hypothetical protein